VDNRLILDKVSKSFGNAAVLKSVSLNIRPGLFGLLGPNGAGKTTLMRVLATLLKPDSGSIRCQSWEWSQTPEQIRFKLGYLPQHFNVFRNITGYECLDYIAVLKGVHQPKERRAMVSELLEKVNLAADAHKKTAVYSGGMKRRLGIAQALLGDPAIVIVDEPTAGLDPQERIRFRNLLRESAGERIILLSTHIVEDIEALCSSVAVLKDGHAVQFESLDDLAQSAVGKVWSCRVPSKDAMKLQASNSFQIMQSVLMGDMTELRILSETAPIDGATHCQPTVEEGYLAWSQE